MKIAIVLYDGDCNFCNRWVCFTNSKLQKNEISFIPFNSIKGQEKIEKFQILKGDSLKKPLKTEIENGHIKSFRRAIYLNKDLKKGDIVKAQDLIALRPMEGIPSVYFEKLISRTLTFFYRN